MIRAEKQSIRNVLGMAQRSSLHRGASGGRGSFESLGSQGSARSSLAAPLRAGSGRLQPLGLQPSVPEIKEEHREEEEE